MTASSKREVRIVGIGGRGVVPGDRVVGQAPQDIEFACGRDVFEAADPQVARGDAGEHCTVEHRLAVHRASGGDDGQRSGGRDAEGVHRFADDVLAQHRADGCQAVAAARERRAARALEVQVASRPLGVDEFAEQQGATVAEPGHPAAELVARIALSDRLGAVGHPSADEQAESVGVAQPFARRGRARRPAAR